MRASAASTPSRTARATGMLRIRDTFTIDEGDDSRPGGLADERADPIRGARRCT